MLIANLRKRIRQLDEQMQAYKNNINLNIDDTLRKAKLNLSKPSTLFIIFAASFVFGKTTRFSRNIFSRAVHSGSKATKGILLAQLFQYLKASFKPKRRQGEF